MSVSRPPFSETSRERLSDPDTNADVDRCRPRVDADALLVALVLVPQSYPRNRFFGLYRWPEARRARRRAALIRSVLAELCCAAEQVEFERSSDGVLISYRLVDMMATRTIRLSEAEFALMRLWAERVHRQDPLSSAVAVLLSEAREAELTRLAHLLSTLHRFSDVATE